MYDGLVIQAIRRRSLDRARHRAFGKLDPGPDIHVDDADDLEHLLRAEVLGERVVEALERSVPVGVGGTGEGLRIAERRPLGLGVKLGLHHAVSVSILARGMPAARAAW